MNQHFRPSATTRILQGFVDHITNAEALQRSVTQAMADRERHFSAERERLTSRINELEELLGLKETPSMIPIVGCRALKKIEPIIQLFAARELVSIFAVSLAIGGENLSDGTIKVYIHHAKVSLKALGIEVKNDFGRGWYLKSGDRAKLRDILGVTR